MDVPKKRGFAESKELRRFFSQEFEKWQRTTRLGISELAERCGVTASYMGHVSRYGRVPGKPVLILLALNFGLKKPEEIFEAAGIKDAWPFDTTTRLVEGNAEMPGFLSVRLDMDGLTSAIREVVKAEVKPRAIRDLTRGRPLRVGYNLNQSFFFDSSNKNRSFAGIFPELFQLTTLTLQTTAEYTAVPYLDAFIKLQSGEIDVYGPIFATPPRRGQALLTRHFAKVALSAVGRRRKAVNLKPLPAPRSLRDLTTKSYEIAVLRDSASHHFALTALGRNDASLLVCDTPDECLERIALTSLPRPAHLMLCDSVIAEVLVANNPDEYELLCATKETALMYLDNAIAVRPDWPELLDLLNDALGFMDQNGAIGNLLSQRVPEKFRELVVA